MDLLRGRYFVSSNTNKGSCLNDISDFTCSNFNGFNVPKKPLELKKLFPNNNPIIGVSWYTTNFKTSVNRSLSCEEISKIISQSGCNFVNLQYGKIDT